MARTFVIMLCMLLVVFLAAMISAKAAPQLMTQSIVPMFKCETKAEFVAGVESHGGGVIFFQQLDTNFAMSHGPVENMDGWFYTVTSIEHQTSEGVSLWCPVAYQSENKGISG